MPQPQPPLGGKNLLKDKNSKLSAQVAVQRKEINRLQQKLQELEDKELQWEDTIACLNTVWEELNLSIGFLKYRATDETQEISVQPVDEEGQLQELLREGNPFLALLLKNYLPDDPKAAAAAKSLAEDLTETEEALRRKMKETLSAATNVLNIVEDLKKHRFKNDINRESECKPMALANLLKSENSKLRSTAIQDAVTIQSLKAAIADKEAELLVMQRKMIQNSENAHDDHIDVLAKKGGEQQNHVLSRTPSAAVLQQNMNDDKEMHAALDARTKEVEERDKQLALAERYVSYSLKLAI
jgi:E3 ubiquitin-protein ligase BRE1